MNLQANMRMTELLLQPPITLLTGLRTLMQQGNSFNPRMSKCMAFDSIIDFIQPGLSPKTARFWRNTMLNGQIDLTDALCISNTGSINQIPLSNCRSTYAKRAKVQHETKLPSKQK